MKLRLPILASTLALAGMMVLTPPAFAASNATAAAPVTAPVAGTLSNGGSFVGQLTNIVVREVNGQLMATANLSGTLLDAAGNVIATVTNVPISNILVTATGTCEILHLTLGPLDLNLLGLMVHLNQVVLDISAQAGPGNLLGNLLCAVAHLLDNNGPLNGIGGLLTNLLRQLGL
jgi:hypothetical protein